ncbi:hypothetical protein [Streptomyces sp. WELS2]|uniref:hypothetical protein n=1 Tax=Streptomyces sp. WELS2 TaxID=2749435 RepID=UPI0015EFDFF0|nr:hypothetical protein [Streptomyces sp. WELS2]
MRGGAQAHTGPPTKGADAVSYPRRARGTPWRDKLTAEQRAAPAALGMTWAGTVPAVEAASEPPAPQPAPPAAPAKRRVRKHHKECDKELYEGGTCTCDMIEGFGPLSERESYWNNL